MGGPDMAPHTPPTLGSAPGNPGRSSVPVIPRGSHGAEYTRKRASLTSRGGLGVSAQDLRSFVAAYREADPLAVVTVREPVSLEYDVMALVLEYERRRRWPILLFEHVAGHDIPIVANVVASRATLARALGVEEPELAAE